MILTIDNEGVTIVEVKSKKQEALLAISITEIMKNIPELETLVVAIMAGKIVPGDLGIDTTVRKIGKDVDIESAIRQIKEEEAVDEKDLSPVLKRILKERADDEDETRL